MHDLRIAMPGKIMTVATPIAPQYHFVDVVALSKEVDFLFVMAYDIEGGWGGNA
jgi:GH18 family chitinase